ncbi:MAG TPA: DMT family transporter, partial [Bacillota bacterium]
ALGAAVGNAVFLLAMDPILRRVPVPDAVAVQFGGGIVAQTVLLVAGGAAGARLAAALPAWPWLLALGVITSGVAVTCLNVGVQRIGAARTAIIGMLEPVFAVVWGVALLGEAFSPLQGLGTALVIAGVAGSIRSG